MSKPEEKSATNGAFACCCFFSTTSPSSLILANGSPEGDPVKLPAFLSTVAVDATAVGDVDTVTGSVNAAGNHPTLSRI